MKLLLICSILLSSGSLFAEEKLKLTSADKKKLEAGEIVVHQVDVPDMTWPEVHVMSLVDANPLESTAIFAAYDYQKEYVPNVILSKPLKSESPTEVIVKYEMKMPFPVPNSKYTNGHELTKVKKGYKVSWWMIESNSTKGVSGFAEFTPYKNKSLFYYKNMVVPESFLAPLFKSAMIKDVKKTVRAIIDHTKMVKKSKPKILKKYKDKIEHALAGKTVY